MKEAPIPSNEQDRIQSLNEHELLDTFPEALFDDITKLASEVTGTPTSLITLVDKDRQWFKSRYNYPTEETPRQLSFCAHAILHSEELMMVPDARYDDRFNDNPLVTGEPNIVFYAGVPITDTLGNALGTICVIDNRPRELTEQQIDSLKALAKLVKTHFELRKAKMDLEKAQEDLKMVQSLVITMQNEIKDVVTNNPEHEELEQLTAALDMAVGSFKGSLGSNEK